MVERDPIEDLNALWSKLETPEPDLGGRDSSEQTLDLEPAVAWMRDAWQSLEASALQLTPVQLIARHRSILAVDGRPRNRKQVLALAFALAASALLLLTFAPRSPFVHEAVLVPEQAFEPARSMAAYTPNSLELRSGSVRLILLDEPTDYAFEDF